MIGKVMKQQKIAKENALFNSVYGYLWCQVTRSIRINMCSWNFCAQKWLYILCVPCITCPEGMESAMKCVRDILYKDDVELEWLPCKTGYYSDGYGTDS